MDRSVLVGDVVDREVVDVCDGRIWRRRSNNLITNRLCSLYSRPDTCIPFCALQKLTPLDEQDRLNRSSSQHHNESLQRLGNSTILEMFHRYVPDLTIDNVSHLRYSIDLSLLSPHATNSLWGARLEVQRHLDGHQQFGQRNAYCASLNSKHASEAPLQRGTATAIQRYTFGRTARV